jgi:hypothetical protein
MGVVSLAVPHMCLPVGTADLNLCRPWAPQTPCNSTH